MQHLLHLHNLDILLLQETWQTQLAAKHVNIPDFCYIASPAQHLSENLTGRLSGGLGVAINNKTCRQERIVTINNHNNCLLATIITHRKSKSSWLIINCYLRPNIPHDQRIEALITIQDLVARFHKCQIVVAGDFNIRIGKLQQKFDIETDPVLAIMSDPATIARTSDDEVISSFNQGWGPNFVNLMSDAQLLILHGIPKCAQTRSFHGPNGKSAVDFIICPLQQYQSLVSCTHVPIDRSWSDHDLTLAIFLTSNINNRENNSSSNNNIKRGSNRTRPRAKPPSNKMYRETVRDNKEDINQHFNMVLQDSINILNAHQATNNVEEANKKLHCLILSNLQHMVEKFGIRPTKSKEYFNEEVSQISKLRSRLIIRLQRESMSEELRADIKTSANWLKEKCRNILRADLTKKRLDIGKGLEKDRTKNPALFWVKIERLVTSSLDTRQTLPEYIRNESDELVHGEEADIVWRDFWKETFRTLQQEEPEPEDLPPAPPFDPARLLDVTELLNSPISFSEINAAMIKLKNRKASGVEQVPAELLKYGGSFIRQTLQLFFNNVFETATIPMSWKLGLIRPTLKKFEDPQDPAGYRGITVLSVLSKLFCLILNERLMAFSEKHNILADEQNGFRPGRGTCDDIFILSETIFRRQQQKLPTHLAYLDVRKAYDTVWRKRMWQELEKSGIRGRILDNLKDLYTGTASCAQTFESDTGWIAINIGVRQGCVLSPLLYAIFVNPVVQRVKQTRGGVQVDDILIHILLYADDMVILAESTEALQEMLDVVHQVSTELRFEMNATKTKTQHFSTARPQQPLTLAGRPLEAVTQFRYLGIILDSNNISWKHSQDDLLRRANSALRLNLPFDPDFDFISTPAKDVVFKAKSRAVAEYASQVIGFGKWPGAEQLQIEAARRILKPPRKTSNDALLAEMGWISMEGRRHILILGFLAKILRTPTSHLIHRVFENARDLHKRGLAPKSSWTSKTWPILQRYQLQHLFDDDVQLDERFQPYEVVEQLEFQLWQERTEQQSKMAWLRAHKHELGRSGFLSQILQPQVRRDLVALRANCFPIRVEYGRYLKEHRDERLCPICACGEVEDEQHFLLRCSALAKVRQRHPVLFEATQRIFESNNIPVLDTLMLADNAIAALSCFAFAEMNKCGIRQPAHRPPLNLTDDQAIFTNAGCKLVDNYMEELCRVRRLMRHLDAIVNPYFRKALSISEADPDQV